MLSIQYAFFLIGALLCLSLLLFLKRKFDFLAIYILILFLYTLPLFFGKVINVYTGGFINANSSTLVVMGCVYFITSLFLLKDNSYIIPNESVIGVEEKIALNVIFIFSIVGMVLYIPTLLSSGSKAELLENTDLLSAVIYSNMPIVGFLLALKVKNKKYLIIFILILFFLFLFGSRRSIAIAFMGSIIILWHQYSFRLIEKYKLILISLVFLSLVILSKTFYGYVLSQGVSQGFSSWISNFEIKYFLTGSEFIGTSTILNSVVENNFKTDRFLYFYSFLSLQPLPLSYFNYSSSYFNDVFQPLLFPGISYGMAYNPWAEVYSAFGYFGVIVLALFVPSILTTLWYFYCNSKTVFSILILMVGLILSFWIERNSLATIFAYIRNIFYPLLLIYFLIIIIKSFMMGRGKK